MNTATIMRNISKMTTYTKTDKIPRYLNDINDNIRTSLADHGITQTLVILAAGNKGKLDTIITYKMSELDLVPTLDALIKVLKEKRAGIINKLIDKTLKYEDEMHDARMRNS